MNSSNSDKKNILVPIMVLFIVGGMAAFGYQMYEHNNRVIERTSSIDIPDYEETAGEWTRYTGSNPCPVLVEQRFDANKSHYICIYQR